jgi:hypothetical protein
MGGEGGYVCGYVLIRASTMALCVSVCVSFNTNIPIMEVKNIIKDVLDRDFYTKQQDNYELLNLTNTILEQNYIQLNNHFYKQNDGLAMGVPTSAILAEIFLQFLKHTAIYKILENTRSSTTTDM